MVRFPVLATLVLGMGCTTSTAPPDAGPPGADAGPPEVWNEVDLLLVLNNSASLSEEQASLAAQLPYLIDALTTGDFDGDGLVASSVHLGVVTADMGTAGFDTPGCTSPDFGDDGILQTISATSIAGCAAASPSFLAFEPGVDNFEPGREAACVTRVGTDGCGFQQPLEAALKALSPSAATAWTHDRYRSPPFYGRPGGHGDGANAGFSRPKAVLAIVLHGNEDDCSARDPDFFDPESEPYRYHPDSPAEAPLRCADHAEEALHSVSRYFDLVRLRRTARRIVYAPIHGIPPDLAPRDGAAPSFSHLRLDSRMQQRIDPDSPASLFPSCNLPNIGPASPPLRLIQLGEQLEARGAQVTMQSVCFRDQRDSVTEVLRAIGRAQRGE